METGSNSEQGKEIKTIPIEFLDTDHGCWKRDLKAMELEIEGLDKEKPGTPKHLRLLRLYLDKLDEDIKRTTEAGFYMSLKALQTLQDNNEFIKKQVKVLERNNLFYKIRVK